MEVSIVKGFDKANFAVFGKLDKKTEDKIKLLTGKTVLRKKATDHGEALLISNTRKDVLDLLSLGGKTKIYPSLTQFQKSFGGSESDDDSEDEDYESEESDDSDDSEEEQESEEKPPVKKSKTPQSVGKSKITVVKDYTEKSFAVYGDTKKYAEKIKEVKGRTGAWKRLAHGMGWVFPSSSTKVMDFFKSIGAEIVRRVDYEKKNPPKVAALAAKPSKSPKKTKPVEKKVPAKAKKQPVTMDEKAMDEDEKKKAPIRKFIKGISADLDSLFSVAASRKVSFHDLKEYVSTFMTTTQKHDQYGMVAHVEIAKIRSKYLEKNVYTSAWDILVADLLRKKYENSDGEPISKVMVWIGKYDPSNYVIVKASKRVSKTAAAKKSPATKKAAKLPAKKSPVAKKAVKSPVKKSKADKKAVKSPAKKSQVTKKSVPAAKKSATEKKGSVKKTTKVATKKTTKKAAKK